MVEEALVAISSPDPNIRKPAEQYLATLEDTAGFVPSLYTLYANSQDPMIKLKAVMLAKNVIVRQWPVRSNASRVAGISVEDKNRIKEMLVHLLFNHEESNEKLKEYLYLGTAAVCKYDFPGNYKELFNQLDQALRRAPSEDLFKFLYLLAKQMSAVRTPTQKNNLKSLANSWLPVVKTYWPGSYMLDKLILCLFIGEPDDDLLPQIIQKASSLLYIPGAEKPLRSILKGISRLISVHSTVLTDRVLESYSQLLSLLISQLHPRSGEQLSLIYKACSCLNDLLLYECGTDFFQPNKEQLLVKVLDQGAWAEGLEMWESGNQEQYLEQGKN